MHCQYENLISGAVLTGVNQLVQSDITYFVLGAQHFYGVFIIDVYSKRIVGHQVSDHMFTTANVQALNQLVELRGEEAMRFLVHHSDHGVQYTSKMYTQKLLDMGCLISMADTAQQNAYAERINGTIKNEYVYLWDISGLEKLQNAVERAVRHYNFYRPHNHLPDKLPPVKFEKALASGKLKKDSHYELVFDENNFHKRPHAKSLGGFDKVPANEHRNKLVCPISDV